MKSPARARILVLLALAPAAPALAFDFIVTRYDDPVPDGCLADDCSLREAVIAANADSGADRIPLSAGTYVVNLTGAPENDAAAGDLDLNNSVAIVGVGAGLTILDGTGLGENMIRASKAGGVFELYSLSIRGSDADGASLGPGTHTVEDCEFSDNGTLGTNAGLALTIGAS